MDKIPFSVYDFFAYLSSGAAVIATADYIFGGELLSKKEVGVTLGVGLVILAYTLGQIAAHFSAWLLELTVVKRFLNPPTILLMGGEPKHPLLKRLFPGYHIPLQKITQERVKEVAASRNFKSEGEGLFQHMYPIVTENERYQARLDEFRNQYGFARSMSFTLVAASVAIFIAHWWKPVHLRWAALALFGGISLFYRYLKFYWQYSYELLLRYSQLPLEPKKKIASALWPKSSSIPLTKAKK